MYQLSINVKYKSAQSYIAYAIISNNYVPTVYYSVNLIKFKPKTIIVFTLKFFFNTYKYVFFFKYLKIIFSIFTAITSF